VNIEEVYDEDLSSFRAAQVEAGGPYTIAEGDSLTLNTSAVLATNAQITSLVWVFQGGEIEVEDFEESQGNITAVTTLTWNELIELGISDDGQYDVALRVTDDRPQVTYDYTTISVNNTAPALHELKVSPAGALEGQAVTLSGRIEDPGAYDTFSMEVNWGDGSPLEVFHCGAVTPLFNKSHRYVDDNQYSITLNLLDNDGGSDSETVMVMVNDVPPIVELEGADEADEGSLYTLKLGAVIDPGHDMVTGYRVNWGDGSSEVFTPSEIATHKGILPHLYVDNEGSGFTITAPSFRV
jgi:hypothetical protein